MHSFDDLPLGHGLPRARLPGAYDVESSFPDLPAYSQRFAQASEQVRAQLKERCRLDLAYGPLPAQRLDAYLPEAAGRAPVLVFFHGGAWRGSNKEGRGHPARVVCARGAIWISVEYPLAPQHTLAEQVASAQRALGWMADQAATLGGDPGRILALGHSAGAHLATMGLYSLLQARPALRPAFSLLTISGIFDLVPLMFTPMNEWLRLDPALAARFSPLAQLPQGGPGLQAFVGGEEPGVFVQQSMNMAAACARAGLPASVTLLPGRNHFTVMEELEQPASALGRALLDFIGGAQ